MKYSLAIFTLLILGSCFGESLTNYEAFLVNSTSHEIKILCFKQGYVNSDDTLKLKAGETLRIANGSRRGLSGQVGFSSDHFGDGNDSCVVYYDKIYKVVHYVNAPSQLAQKYLEYSNTRNILQLESYSYYYSDRSKYIRDQTYTFTFTESDYLFAKN